jgi:hypothetical protein
VEKIHRCAREEHRDQIFSFSVRVADDRVAVTLLDSLISVTTIIRKSSTWKVSLAENTSLSAGPLVTTRTLVDPAAILAEQVYRQGIAVETTLAEGFPTRKRTFPLPGIVLGSIESHSSLSISRT